MTEVLAQLPVVLSILVLMLAGPVIAVAMLQWHKRRARQRRRSPLGIDLLRAPGHSLRLQADELRDDLMTEAFALTAFPPCVVAIFFAQAQHTGMERALHLIPIYGVTTLAAMAWFVYRLVRRRSELDNLRVGYDAEVSVGQELDQLMRRGAAVFHDFPADRFNIDHVVISAKGVFAVETKGYTKRNDKRGKAGATVVFNGESLTFPHWTTKHPLEQAVRQAEWLERWLASSVGEAVKVTPVVALPGWFVERKGRGAVRVFSGRELAGLVDSVGTSPLTPELVQRVSHQVEQKCRDVQPTYS